MEYKKLELDDIDAFAENRMEFVTSIRNIENISLFRAKTKQYIKKHINSDSLIVYIAMDDKKIISSCMLSIFETIPLPSNYNGKVGELLNVYTKKEYRRQGHSSNLIKLLINEARTKKVSKIVLTYTDEGYPLYKSLGFKESYKEMEYIL